MQNHRVLGINSVALETLKLHHARACVGPPHFEHSSTRYTTLFSLAVWDLPWHFARNTSAKTLNPLSPLRPIHWSCVWPLPLAAARLHIPRDGISPKNIRAWYKEKLISIFATLARVIFRLSLVSGNLPVDIVQPNPWRDIRQCVTPVNARACPTPIRTEH
jgi:hypothetical protein